MKKVKGMQEAMHDIFLEEASIIESIVDSYIHNKIEPETDGIKLFVSLSKNGLNIHKVMMAVFSVREKWFKEKGVIYLEVDFAEEIKNRDERTNKKREINNAITRLLHVQPIPTNNPLEEALHLDVNKKVNAMRKAITGFREVMDEYLFYVYPKERNQNLEDSSNVISREIALQQHPSIFRMFYDDNKRGKATTTIKLTHSTEGVWNDAVVTIVDELRGINDSQRQAFKTTETILNLFYPDHYPYSDGNRAKSMYKYHKAK